MAGAPFCLVRPAWRDTLGLKSRTRPSAGSVSRTARVPIARWGLKEAAGKSLVRRTGSAYEAILSGKEANISKAR